MLRTAAALAVALAIVAAADVPATPALPTWDQLGNLGPSGILAAIVGLFVMGRIGPMSLVDRADARAEKATAAAAATTESAAATAKALAELTEEHKRERTEWAQEMAGLQRELRWIATSRHG